MPELHANIFTLGEHNFLKPYWGVVKDIDMKIYDFQCNKIGYNPYGDKRAVPVFSPKEEMIFIVLFYELQLLISTMILIFFLRIPNCSNKIMI